MFGGRGHVIPESTQAFGWGRGNGTGTPAMMPWTTVLILLDGDSVKKVANLDFHLPFSAFLERG